MATHSALGTDGTATLPRRDLIAIFAFLNRRSETVGTDRDPVEQVEGVLQQLAAAARMQ